MINIIVTRQIEGREKKKKTQKAQSKTNKTTNQPETMTVPNDAVSNNDDGRTDELELVGGGSSGEAELVGLGEGSGGGGGGGSGGGGRVKGPWSPEEDAVLSRLVSKFGARNWSLIARGIPGRSGKSCRLRWCNQLDPCVKRKPFSGNTSIALNVTLVLLIVVMLCLVMYVLFEIWFFGFWVLIEECVGFAFFWRFLNVGFSWDCLIVLVVFCVLIYRKCLGY